MLIEPATWFIWVKYSPQCQLRDVVYLTVVTYNIQYLQYFCDDIENSCIMNLKWLGLQSILFYRGNIYWVWHRTLFLALIWSVYFVSGDHICMRAPRKTWTTHLFFWAYPPISPYFFGAPCFRSFFYFSDATAVSLRRFYIDSANIISGEFDRLVLNTQRSDRAHLSELFVAVRKDQLQRLTSFLSWQCRTSIIQGASINTLHSCKKLAKTISIFGGRAYSYVRMARLTTA